MHPNAALTSLGVRPKKAFSQNFLSSPHWAEKMALQALHTSGVEALWEIGPGLGAITEHLARSGKPLRLFECDRTLCGYLREKFPDAEVVEGDFLEFGLNPPAFENKKIGLVSNLPYHVSSPILFKLLPWRFHFACWVMGFQKELAQRIKAKKGTKVYGSLSVLLQNAFEVVSMGTIGPGSFYPSPGVDSEALCFFPVQSEVAIEKIQEVARVGFSQRRKYLVKNLSGTYGREQVMEAFESLGIDERVRAEALTPSEFCALAKKLCIEREKSDG